MAHEAISKEGRTWHPSTLEQALKRGPLKMGRQQKRRRSGPLAPYPMILWQGGGWAEIDLVNSVG